MLFKKNGVMKVAVIGSRSFNDYEQMKGQLEKLEIKEIISGGSKGADELAERYAKEKSLPITIIKPNWKRYGKAAGVIRNKDIITTADLIIAFWDEESKGTLNSINLAKKTNKPCFIFKFTKSV
jgi:predicted Rossmann fold nucleotide-binding protein DprA/Smf involved in DNA uptake